MKKIILFVSTIILLSACAGKKTTTEKQMVGNDKDEHGCIASAGYVWSEVRNNCIRLFEDGVAVKSVDNADEVAYVVLSQDSLKAQLFYSGEDKHEVLSRTGSSQKGYVWSDTKNSSIIKFENNKWTISLKGKTKFEQTK